MCRLFIERGAKVVAVDLNEKRGAALAQVFGGDLVFRAADITADGIAEELVRVAVQEFSKLDVLVNNAHASRQKQFLDLTDEDWELSFNTGFFATRNFMLAAYEQLKQSKGSIVSFGSAAGLMGQPTQGAYASAMASA